MSDDILDIIVYGTSLYTEIVKDIYSSLADEYQEQSTQIIAVAVGMLVKSKTALGKAYAVNMIYVALIMKTHAQIMNLIANDPPRTDYKVGQLSQAPMIDTLSGNLVNEFNSLILTTRHLFDWLELWQGARLADDQDWEAHHAKKIRDTYIQLRYQIQITTSMLDDYFANLAQMLKKHGVSLEQVNQVSSQLAGQKLIDINDVATILNDTILWDSPILDGFEGELREEINSTVLEKFDQEKLLSTLKEIWDLAKTL